MNFIYNDDMGKLLLRLSVGFLLLFHGYEKLVNGVGFIEGLVVNTGLPAFVAYGVYIGEVIAPLFLILGIKVRLAALVIVFTMLNAIVFAHMNDIFSLSKHGAWAIELPMFFLLSSLAIVFFGGGRYMVTKS